MPLFLLLAAARAEEDPVALLASREVDQRIRGVEAIREKGHADAEALLLKATKDKDWEVVELAVVALAARGTGESVEPLVPLALRGPVRRIRLAAARTLKALGPERAADKIVKRLRGKEIIAAAEALEILAQPATARGLEKIVERKGKKEDG